MLSRDRPKSAPMPNGSCSHEGLLSYGTDSIIRRRNFIRARQIFLGSPVYHNVLTFQCPPILFLEGSICFEAFQVSNFALVLKIIALLFCSPKLIRIHLIIIEILDARTVAARPGASLAFENREWRIPNEAIVFFSESDLELVQYTSQ